MGFYDDQVLPRFTEVALGRPMEAIRARVAAGLSGEVLEIGFGSGRNVPHLPGGVTRLLAVEPGAVGRRLASPPRLSRSSSSASTVRNCPSRIARSTTCW